MIWYLPLCSVACRRHTCGLLGTTVPKRVAVLKKDLERAEQRKNVASLTAKASPYPLEKVLGAPALGQGEEELTLALSSPCSMFLTALQCLP